MSQNIKEEHLSNWTMFGSKTVLIELYKHTNGAGETVYNSALSFWLDDGVENSDKHISIFTDIWNECPHCCVVQTASNIRVIFDNIADAVITIDDDGKVLNDEEYSLTEMMSEEDDYIEDRFEASQFGNTTYTVH